MMPNVAGERSTQTQILVYSVLLALASLIPALTGLAGLIYAGAGRACSASSSWFSRRGSIAPTASPCASRRARLFTVFAELSVRAVSGAACRPRRPPLFWELHGEDGTAVRRSRLQGGAAQARPSRLAWRSPLFALIFYVLTIVKMGAGHLQPGLVSAAWSTRSTPQTNRGGGNLRIVVILVGIVVGMTGLAYAAVPLYYAFCAATGYGGTTQRRHRQSQGRHRPRDDDAVRCDGRARPAAQGHPVPAGRGPDRHGADHPFHGAGTCRHRRSRRRPSFNVTPDLAGAYFNKIQCFCFTEQTLKPGETADMPVTFFVDPDIDKDPDLEDGHGDHLVLYILCC